MEQQNITLYVGYSAASNRITQIPLTLDPVPHGPTDLQGVTRYKTPDGIEVFAFDHAMDKSSPRKFVMVHMVLPQFFNEVKGAGIDEDIIGMFLVSLPQNDESIGTYIDLKQGKHGCPTLIDMRDLSANNPNGSEFSDNVANRFTFNKMSFHPFLMLNKTIGWYICDQGGNFDWKNDEEKYLLGIDDPIIYDATLGLYATRGATLHERKNLAPLSNEEEKRLKNFSQRNFK